MMETPKIEIHYKRAKFGRRVLANVVDFILFIVSFILLFLLTRTIVASTPEYDKKLDEMNVIKVESALFVEVDNDIIDVITYNKAFDFSEPQKVINSKIAIKGFVSYMKTHSDSEETYQSLVKDLKESALNPKVANNNGIPIFMDDGTGHIINNPECTPVSAKTKFTLFYEPAIDTICRSYLLTGVPHYYELTKYLSNMLFFVEIPISYLLSGILIYFVPTLFFRKGRKTLGKAMYYIGVVDERLLNPSFGRSLARFSIFYFGELILSLFTFGIPAIISFSLMAFSKNKQGFPDYMLGLNEVDTSDNHIYNTYDDITLDTLKRDKKPVNFEMSRME